ncbi:MAG: endopeptidase La [Sphaerochaetaceae bacterium]|jgi:ATP-dependent Lon protease|nr:endopeptidase La [Sphaerochaetaceae bacterium]
MNQEPTEQINANDNEVSQALDSKKQDDLVKVIPFGLKDSPVFPGLFTSILVNDPADIKLIKESQDKEVPLALTLLKAASPTFAKPATAEQILTTLINKVSTRKTQLTQADFKQMGTLAVIEKVITFPDGRLNVFIKTISRVKLVSFLEDEYPYAMAKIVDPGFLPSTENTKMMDKILTEKCKYLFTQYNYFSEDFLMGILNSPDLNRKMDFIASCLNLTSEERYGLLCAIEPVLRFNDLMGYISREDVSEKAKKEIVEKTEAAISQAQRQKILEAQYNIIKSELGLGDGQGIGSSNSALTKLMKKLDSIHFPKEVKETVDNELSKLKIIPPVSSEYPVIFSYLELIASLPWDKSPEKPIDLAKVREAMDKDHYGLKDVKERILEFLAVRKQTKTEKGAIICLVGPPGTGKTSIAQSLSRSMGKKLYRFSVGGVDDPSEIKGHRRTYVGAMPGKVIQGMKIAGQRNCILLIDEIDKMNNTYRGDPGAALLEALDPEQNVNFRDNYLDLPFDLSQVLFVLTANSLETIPRPLLDRMEVIKMEGYTSAEKLEIARTYLVPKLIKKNGLTRATLKFPDEILLQLADEYAREAGVRDLEKSIDKVMRKFILERDTKPDFPKTLTLQPSDLERYLGQPRYKEDEVVRADRPGLALGLAWTSAGGDVMLTETQKTLGKGDLSLTGQLGDVMKESTQIARTYIKSICPLAGLDPAWFDQHNIHIHFPEGATPKDGPSAGITIATALFGLLTDQTIMPDLAMTGELSLSGKVMPIGGLKEKLLAARRNKVTTVILPKFNKKDLDELDKVITEGMTFHLVDDMKKVIELAFPSNAYPLDKTPVEPKAEDPQQKAAQAFAEALAKALKESGR